MTLPQLLQHLREAREKALSDINGDATEFLCLAANQILTLIKICELQREALEFYSMPAKYHTHHASGHGLGGGNRPEEIMSQMEIDSGYLATETIRKCDELAGGKA